MAKKDKSQSQSDQEQAHTVAPATKTPVLDITKLTPEQLKSLRKQLKEQAKESNSTKDQRFEIIDAMLQEKNGEEFKNSTRDIVNRLADAGLLKPGYDDQVEIKKVQSRKQFLEKKTDEKGNLVYTEGTFGYKKSDAMFGLSPARIIAWFENEENTAKLTNPQIQHLRELIANIGN